MTHRDVGANFPEYGPLAPFDDFPESPTRTSFVSVCKVSASVDVKSVHLCVPNVKSVHLCVCKVSASLCVHLSVCV